MGFRPRVRRRLPRGGTAGQPPTAPGPGPGQAAASPDRAMHVGDGAAMRLAKQAGAVVGLVSGVVGLFFLLFPEYTPRSDDPAPEQSASISGMVSNARTTR